MTEPAPGGGSDPSMIKTYAEKNGDTWMIYGRKWFITGADGAAHFILAARTSDDRRKGITTFLFHKDQPGWRIVRRIEIMGPEEHGGHCELEFDGLEVHDDDVLGGVGNGLKMVQVRLGPARLTHCMRWLGWSKRCMEIAQEYVEPPRGLRHQARRPRERADEARRGRATTSRSAGCSPCTRRGSSIRATSRARRCRWPRCTSPTRCTRPPTWRSSSAARAAIPRTRSLEWVYRAARAARLVDGADEVHKMVLAKFMREEGRDFWSWSAGQTRVWARRRRNPAVSVLEVRVRLRGSMTAGGTRSGSPDRSVEDAQIRRPVGRAAAGVVRLRIAPRPSRRSPADISIISPPVASICSWMVAADIRYFIRMKASRAVLPTVSRPWLCMISARGSGRAP